MKKLSVSILIVMTGMFSHVTFAGDNTSPVGYWKTIDDVTGQVKSVIQITENAKTHTLDGKIVKTYPTPGEQPLERCSACKDERHNQRILGMTILNGLKENKDNPSSWSAGLILDPRNGKIYHCTAQLKDNNNKLSVRGYIGIPLFGRSQEWIRVNAAGDPV